jgi:hypothetical protein
VTRATPRHPFFISEKENVWWLLRAILFHFGRRKCRAAAARHPFFISEEENVG